MSGISLRHLCFTGPTKAPATLEFGPGLNVIYGASESGKSFVLEAIDFMFGAKGPLRDIPERVGYDRIWLGLQTGDEFYTLMRSTNGGNFELHQGLIRAAPETPGVVLAAKHSAASDENVSAFLLKRIGLRDMRIRKNAEGETNSLSFRTVAHLCIVNETDIQKQNSPVETGETVTKTPEWSTFKLLLTGVDDSALVTIAKDPAQEQARSGKLEVLNELILEYKRRLGEQIDEPQELDDQYQRLQATITQAQHAMRATEAEYQTLATRRAQTRGKVDTGTERQAELKDMFARFRLLESHYGSDLDRLQAMREAGSAVAALSPVNCPLCGAVPAQQHLDSDCAGNLDKVVSAVDAESAKIQRLREELASTVEHLGKEEASLNRLMPRLRADLAEIEGQIRGMAPTIQQARASYTELVDKRASVLSALSLANNVAELQKRRLSIEVREKTPPAVETERADMSVSTADLFAKSVESLLNAWDFPGAERVFFNLNTKDLIISGKPRGSRGKGLRAITHAAFTIGLAEFCWSEGRPHPGFVVLDSPLLAYREPEAVEGDEDLTGTDLQNRFYQYLAKWTALQAIIIENTSPPAGVASRPLTVFFSKNPHQGRYGLFPTLATSGVT
ncbi:MAG: hypothetical protein WB439_17975 [Acidobacteriaceae bacterium]